MRQGERGCISLGYAEPDCKLIVRAGEFWTFFWQFRWDLLF